MKGTTRVIKPKDTAVRHSSRAGNTAGPPTKGQNALPAVKTGVHIPFRVNLASPTHSSLGTMRVISSVVLILDSLRVVVAFVRGNVTEKKNDV